MSTSLNFVSPNQMKLSPPLRPSAHHPSSRTLVDQSLEPHFDWTIKRFQIEAIITPKICREWKKRNPPDCNRPLNQEDAIRFGMDMQEGNWKANGEAIIFNSKGEVHDGQHRIEAGLLADVPFISDVRFGVDPATWDSNDTGSKRTASDAAAREKFKHYVMCAAGARLICVCKRYGTKAIRDPHKQPTQQQVVRFMRENREALQDAADLAQGARRLIAPGLLCACVYLFCEQDRDAAIQFVTDLKTGVGLSETSAVHHLRRRLTDNGASKSKLPTFQILALVLKAWVCYRDGIEVRNLRWRNDGPKAEDFPTI